MGDATTGHQSSTHPTDTSSGWTINWWGLAGLLLVAVIALFTWQWLGGSDADDAADERVVSATSAPSDSVETTTRDTTTTTTSPTSTTAEPTTTTTTVPERQVLIRGEMKPCQYGANCLVASFTIVGFEPRPGRFVCIYPNSVRDFDFNKDQVDEACLTADAGDTITIEVDGVRSATISEQNLDGT